MAIYCGRASKAACRDPFADRVPAMRAKRSRHAAFESRLRFDAHYSGRLLGLLDQQPPILHANLESADGLVGGRSQRITRAQAETRPVARADDLAGLGFSADKALAVVAATIFHCEEIGAAGD